MTRCSLAQVARLRDAAGNVCFFVFRESHIVIEGVPLNVQRRQDDSVALLCGFLLAVAFGLILWGFWSGIQVYMGGQL